MNESQSVHVKAALFDAVEGSLSADGDTRRGAEERLKALEVTESMPIHLLEFVMDKNLSPPLRQLSCVLLRQYVDTHWSPIAEKFVAPEPNEQTKMILRTTIPLALQEPQSKIRNSVALVISQIAHWDWPENWPNLFEILLVNLKHPKGISGAMRVLTEFAKDLTEQHAAEITPMILPEMLRILEDRTGFSVHTRTRAVEIFRTIVTLVTQLSDLDRTGGSKLMEPYLEPFLEEFGKVLMERNLGVTDLGLKKAVIKTISTLLVVCPKKLMPYLHQILTPVWNILTFSIQDFQRSLTGTDDDPEIDSDGEECGIDGLIFSVFELVRNLTERSSGAELVKNGLPDLLYYIIFYMQLPQERVELWIADPTTFATDEDEDGATYTLRVCAQDLLVATCDEFPDECIMALGHAVNRHLGGNSDWRLQEACLLAVSSLGPRIIKPVTQDPYGAVAPNFDIHGFMQNIVFPGLCSPDILLAGRCLVLGSLFCTTLTPDLTRRFVQVATDHITQPDKNIISKVLACKALGVFVEQAKENLTVKMVLLEILPGAMDSLINFAVTQPVEILAPILDTIVGILRLDEPFTVSLGQKITTLAIACFLKYNSDPVVCPILEDMVKALCSNLGCVQTLQERFVPTLVSVLNNHSPDMNGTQGVALDILTAIVRASPVPLSPILMHQAFPAIINSLHVTEDHTVLQNGGETLRAYIAASPAQVVEFHDSTGTSGLGRVVQFTCRLLDPTASEFSASLVGKLVSTLIMKTGDQLGDQLEHLLRAVLSKLQSADTLSVIQNLCMVYAHLFNVQIHAALNFLDSVPGPSGESALHFVMTEWVSRQQCFFGLFDRKVSSMALSKILEHGVQTQDPRLASIQVRGEPIMDAARDGHGPVTRSQRTQDEWTRVPLLVKVFKLLLHELSYTALDETETDDDESGGGESSSGDETSGAGGDNKENQHGGGKGHLGDALYNDESLLDLDLDDPDAMNHELYFIDLDKYLKDFLREFSSHIYYPEFYRHLNPDEIRILKASEIPEPKVN